MMMATATADPVEVLERCKTIAVVGASRNAEKEAHMVPRYLKDHGYRVIPVNPTATEILGEKAYPSLVDLPAKIASAVDVVEVFRPSVELPRVALQTVELARRRRRRRERGHGRRIVFWAQQGLEDEGAKRILNDDGVPYVMDACMRVVHHRLRAGSRER